MLHGKKPITAELVQELQTNIAQCEPPDMPAHLNKREQEVWHSTVALLRQMMAMRKVDVGVLGAYCTAYVLWQKSQAAINANKSDLAGMCLLDDKGKPRGINPLIQVSSNAQRDMVFYAAQLGMTPAARLKMVAGVKGIIDKNPFTKIKAMKDDKKLD